MSLKTDDATNDARASDAKRALAATQALNCVKVLQSKDQSDLSDDVIRSRVSPGDAQSGKVAKIIYVRDTQMLDGSVYSTYGPKSSDCGEKRDFIHVERDGCVKPYTFDDFENQEHRLAHPFFKDGRFCVEKHVLFKNDSDVSLHHGKIVPSPTFKKNDPFDIASQFMYPIKMGDGDVVRPGEKFDVTITLRIPETPGVFVRYFEVRDKDNRIIFHNKHQNRFWAILRVVPHRILAPVIGAVDGTELKGPEEGRETGAYTKKGYWYFCNWGPKFWDRTGVKIPNTIDVPKTHRTYDRYAWDIHRMGGEWGKPVCAVSRGKVVHINTNYGALWIHHDYDPRKPKTTGFYAVYMHMLEESWNNEESLQAWKPKGKNIEEGAIIQKEQLLGKIGARANGNDKGLGEGYEHLHFAIYPLTFDSGHPDKSGDSPSDWLNGKGLGSVHVNFKWSSDVDNEDPLPAASDG